jgi:CRP/FNR family cyclic AMP-dependent transcriptional regulator
VSDTGSAMEKMLTEHGFLAGISARTVALLARDARLENFGTGEFLLHEGEVADTVFLITEGRVAIEIHSPERGPLVLDTIEPGHIVGLSWVAPPFRWQFDARALTHVEAVALDAARLSEALALHPEAAAELHRRLSTVLLSRLQATRIRLLDLYANVGRY